MNIKIKLYTALKKYGPSEKDEFNLEMGLHKIEAENPESEICLENVLKFLKIPDSLRFSVLVNGRYSDRTRTLKNGDRLIIFPLLDGG